MKFDLSIDGKIYKVELGIDKLINVEIEGKTYQAETKETSAGINVILDKKKFLVRFEGAYISINGKKHSVEICNLRRGILSLDNEKDEVEDTKVGMSAYKTHSGDGTIHPPMPGRVIKIKVKIGESVKMGSPILVLEAMKMQNEITSNIDGIVREIRVSEGDLVESEDVLVVISN